jgi:hypothetical protein
MSILNYDDFLSQQSHTSLTKLLSTNLLRCYKATIENAWTEADLYYKYAKKCGDAIERMTNQEVDLHEVLMNQLDLERHKRNIKFDK